MRNRWYIPEILEKLRTESSFRWGRVDDVLLDMWSDPENRKLASQIQAGAWVRILAEQESYVLVQSEDQTLGWVPKVVLHEEEPPKDVWRATWAHEGEAIKAQQLVDVEQMLDIYMDIPYLMGGTTRAGIDCSGLVQRWFVERFGILLPKHSWNQKRYGMLIDRNKLDRDDLIFCLGKQSEKKHVGIYLGDERVVHATKRKNKVVVWEFALFEKIYDVQEYRRIIVR
jgi:cell wall-associated NlpC family hydrolase